MCMCACACVCEYTVWRRRDSDTGQSDRWTSYATSFVPRSSVDDYCPQSQVDVIQQKTLDMLCSLYSDTQISLNYSPRTTETSDVNNLSDVAISALDTWPTHAYTCVCACARARVRACARVWASWIHWSFVEIMNKHVQKPFLDCLFSYCRSMIMWLYGDCIM